MQKVRTHIAVCKFLYKNVNKFSNNELYLNYDHENVLIFFNEGYQIKAEVVPMDVLVGRAQ